MITPEFRFSFLPVLICTLFFSLLVPVGSTQENIQEKKIVLIGGPKSHGPGQHDFPHGIQLFKGFLEASPEARKIEGLIIDAYPSRWPPPGALTGASTLVLYFDGVDKHPLLDSDRLAEVEALVRQGVGLVALHQASTLPEDDQSIPLVDWLGGARYGMVDRTTEPARFNPAASGHPVGRGVGEFILQDEYYLTLRFASQPVTPILTGRLRPHFANGSIVVEEPQTRDVGWTWERKDGGRSFTFTGGHYLLGLDHPELRKLLLNAIFWTARLEVPSGGVQTDAPAHAARLAAFPGSGRPAIAEAIVTRPAQNEMVDFPWGRIEWHVSGPLGNSDTLTTGVAIINPGQSNPRHYHPNCDEVLHVVQGRIRHTMNDRTVEMTAGDTVSIPQGTLHNATNLGDEDAILAISFSTAWREVVGE